MTSLYEVKSQTNNAWRVKHGRKIFRGNKEAASAYLQNIVRRSMTAGAQEPAGYWTSDPAIAFINETTSDDRMFSQLTNRQLPLPLLMQKSLAEGHSGAVLVGRIDTIDIDEKTGEVQASGIFDNSDDGREAMRRVELGLQTGISVDVSATDVIIEPYEFDDDGFATRAKTVYNDASVIHATLVYGPAFANSRIKIDDALTVGDEDCVECKEKEDDALVAGFNPDQPRDARGMWTSDGGEAVDVALGKLTIGDVAVGNPSFQNAQDIKVTADLIAINLNAKDPATPSEMLEILNEAQASTEGTGLGAQNHAANQAYDRLYDYAKEVTVRGESGISKDTGLLVTQLATNNGVEEQRLVDWVNADYSSLTTDYFDSNGGTTASGAATTHTFGFNPDQERDENGRWSGSGSSDTADNENRVLNELRDPAYKDMFLDLGAEGHGHYQDGAQAGEIAAVNLDSDHPNTFEDVTDFIRVEHGDKAANAFEQAILATIPEPWGSQPAGYEKTRELDQLAEGVADSPVDMEELTDWLQSSAPEYEDEDPRTTGNFFANKSKTFAFDPDQTRDERGRWTADGATAVDAAFKKGDKDIVGHDREDPKNQEIGAKLLALNLNAEKPAMPGDLVGIGNTWQGSGQGLGDGSAKFTSAQLMMDQLDKLDAWAQMDGDAPPTAESAGVQDIVSTITDATGLTETDVYNWAQNVTIPPWEPGLPADTYFSNAIIASAPVAFGFDPSQPRDERGRWATDGGDAVDAALNKIVVGDVAVGNPQYQKDVNAKLASDFIAVNLNTQRPMSPSDMENLMTNAMMERDPGTPQYYAASTVIDAINAGYGSSHPDYAGEGDPKLFTAVARNLEADNGIPREQLDAWFADEAAGTGEDDIDIRDFALTASAPVAPPREWFESDLREPTPLTVTPDGQVFGHIATWGTCHIGRNDVCLTAPTSKTSYAYFLTGEVLCNDGSPVSTGVITLDTGHADMTYDHKSATRHYDDTGTAGADVVAGDDEFGVWVAGAIRPTLSDEDMRTFRASAPSGDWRRIRGNLELVAVLAVNVPGFPVPRARLASGVETSLVAAAAPIRKEENTAMNVNDITSIVGQLVEKEFARREVKKLDTKMNALQLAALDGKMKTFGNPDQARDENGRWSGGGGSSGGEKSKEEKKAALAEGKKHITSVLKSVEEKDLGDKSSNKKLAEIFAPIVKEGLMSWEQAEKVLVGRQDVGPKPSQEIAGLAAEAVKAGFYGPDSPRWEDTGMGDFTKELKKEGVSQDEFVTWARTTTAGEFINPDE